MRPATSQSGPSKLRLALSRSACGTKDRHCSSRGRRENVNATYVGKLLPLAYLAPDLTEVILNGRQPPLLMVKHIRTIDIPLEWNAQRQVFARFNE
jgi:hypothetical protein